MLVTPRIHASPLDAYRHRWLHVPHGSAPTCWKGTPCATPARCAYRAHGSARCSACRPPLRFSCSACSPRPRPQAWKGALTTAADGTATVSDAGWNSSLAPGASTAFGIVATTTGAAAPAAFAGCAATPAS
ncbi:MULTISPECIES: cellulose binding domain-containing protein [Streptomyces]|uniref:cellulose binding domain-containing protein n=1 Tax=Streptomyces TaxID=1883 RepID=UPI00167829ED